MSTIIKNHNKCRLVSYVTFQITLVLLLITTCSLNAKQTEFVETDSLIAQSTKKKFDTGQYPQEEITRAETLLFLDNHLSKIKSSKQLNYSIRSAGILAKDSSDVIKVFLEFKKKIVSANAVLSSGRNVSYLNIVKFPQNNPIILYFLERDILEMQRLTKGQPNYFRKRIRAALAEGPKIKKLKKTFNGKTINALSFSIKPYSTDPLRNSPGRAKYKRYSKKLYTFTLSDEVPGHVLEIITNIPTKNKEKTYLKEVLVFSDSKNM